MAARLTAQMLVAALVRQANAQGGFAAVLRKGDAIGGTILVQLLAQGRFLALLERLTDLDGRVSLAPCGPSAEGGEAEIAAYVDRRGRSDPDLWVVELDVPEGERLAARVLADG